MCKPSILEDSETSEIEVTETFGAPPANIFSALFNPDQIKVKILNSISIYIRP